MSYLNSLRLGNKPSSFLKFKVECTYNNEETDYKCYLNLINDYSNNDAMQFDMKNILSICKLNTCSIYKFYNLYKRYALSYFIDSSLWDSEINLYEDIKDLAHIKCNTNLEKIFYITTIIYREI